MTLRNTLAVALALLPLGATAQLSRAERQGIDDALYIGNFVETDLQYDRTPQTLAQPLNLSLLGLQKPLAAADALQTLHARADDTLAGVLGTACSDIFEDTAPGGSPASLEGVEVGAEVPEPLRRPVMELIGAIADANATIKAATSKLSQDEKRLLIEGLPQAAALDTSIHFDFVKRPRPSEGEIRELIAKVDLGAIRTAAWLLAVRIQNQLPKLRELARTVQLKSTLKFKSKSMNVELSGQEDDSHDAGDTNLCIDLGGNDRYTGRYAGGPGYASVLIDLGGDDTYHVPDLSAGAGVLGIGLAYDLGGTDRFGGGSICFGAGLAGVGAFFKDGGSDLYETSALSLGYGRSGIGLLVDTKGDDRYFAKALSEGAAGPGGAGWLVDQSGADTYRMSGSGGQGYAAGTREGDSVNPGGVGLLTDLSGADIYVAGGHCQGCGVNLGLGSLCDSTGNDLYSASDFCQGVGAESGSGYMIDLAGDDSYIAKGGVCHAFGQDRGVGFLLDREGDDVYAARDSRPATANANGLAIFLDAGGNDRYFGPPAEANEARGVGSLAVFADLAGQDVYSQTQQDGQAAARDSWAVFYDAEGSGETPVQVPDAAKLPNPGTLPMPDSATVDRLFARAASDESALNSLVGIGEPALKWLLENRLAGASASQVGVLATMVKAVKSDAPLLIEKIGSPSDAESVTALRVAAAAAIPGAGTAVVEALKRPALERDAADAAGVLNVPGAVPTLMGLSASDDQSLALRAMVALVRIGDPSTAGTAQALLDSTNLPLRKVALELAAKFPTSGMPVARALLGDPAERRARIGIELLSAIGSPDALSAIGPYLAGGQAGIRISALCALNGRCPAEFRQRFLALRTDASPLVRAVARQSDPGR